MVSMSRSVILCMISMGNPSPNDFLAISILFLYQRT
jgi:hypothetical protein